jgi:hypothetical protein
MTTFTDLNVPAKYGGDVDEIWNEAISAIKTKDNADELLKLAALIWALPGSISDALFHTIEQLIE